MLFIIACVTFVLCIALSLGQSAVVAAFIHTLLRRAQPTADPAQLPKAAVILALRGPDPFLGACLNRLLDQDYPDYTVFLVVDSDRDPVLQDIHRSLGTVVPSNVKISILREPSPTCSLKCNSLIQAVGGLDETYEVVAFLDGDVAVHPNWLSELAQPLADDSVGVTTGNRWYVPQNQWGSWVRYCWNVGAVVQVWLNKITWAGSMAMSTKTIKEIDLLDAWRSAISVDATVHRQVHAHQRKVHFVPTVLMVNREETSLPNFISWVQRQLIAAKSCGAGWRLVAIHALNLTATQLLAIGVLIIGCAGGNQMVTFLAAASLAAYWGTSLLAIIATEWAARKTVRENGETISWRKTFGGLRLAVAMLVTQAAYPYALAFAVFRNRISWRGIEYEIRGTGNIAMLNYQPYAETPARHENESVI